MRFKAFIPVQFGMSRELHDFIVKMFERGGNSRFEIQDVLEHAETGKGIYNEADAIRTHFGEIIFERERE